ncbi:MAG: metallophosphoesterase family protein [Candidatus Omnitrophota bacterium]
MKYVIFSDIHGNLEAFESVLADAARENPDRYFCAGDIIGYGANPVECLRKTKTLGAVTVCGNHEWAVLDMTLLEYFADYARQAVEWTSTKLSARKKDYIKSLQLTYADDEMAMVHGTWMRPEKFDYVFDFQIASQMLKAIPAKVCFIGHSHVSGVFCGKNGSLEYSAGPKITVEKDKGYLVNVGSVGQPRDGDWRASYCIWDKEKGTIEIKRVKYDIEKAKDKIRKAGLPASLAARLGEGR